MTESRVFYLADEQVRRRVAQFAMGDAPAGWRVEFRAPKRSDIQSSKMHAMFGDIAKQHLYIGRQLTSTQWKTLFISGHAIATGAGADMVPGIEGEFVNIRESSATMSVKRMSSVIEYVSAWSAENNIVWSNEKREAA